MDLTAATLCYDNNINIVVFDMGKVAILKSYRRSLNWDDYNKITNKNICKEWRIKMPKEIINQCEQRMQKQLKRSRKILQQFVLVRLIQVF